MREAERVAGLDWPAITDELDVVGSAPAGTVLRPAEAAGMAAMFDDDARFRSTIDMARHRFGEGRYRYFARPLPPIVEELRAAFWRHLRPVACDWAQRLRRPAPWPEDFDEWIEMCHAAGQQRPTPLLLSYGPGDWNALHRDLYGDLVFPLQVVVGLSRPGEDFTGGEFVTVEQRPRAQSRPTARSIGLGEAVVFTTSERPVRGARGWSAAPMRHGVSVVRSGHRRTLGLVLHDAT
ncbi:2OG-Fe(II) oxygenase [Desertimonas flava]|uniref:2OG-Fe(II) oxygenase n=1 Tax=Desertimonas flava TaxID=2064846 RepID=UPI00187875A3|nr:2OG-Fe(II) oxygenase [Desertimonas flava]